VGETEGVADPAEGGEELAGVKRMADDTVDSRGDQAAVIDGVGERRQVVAELE